MTDLNCVDSFWESNLLYLHFFPARALPFKIPSVLHRRLDRKLGFMIYATVRKS